MVTSAQAILTGALLKLGVLAQGEPLSAPMGQDGLRLLNQLVESLNLQPFSEIAESRNVFTVTANVGSYTIGSGADLDVARPEAIRAWALNLTTTSPETEIPGGDTLTDQAWRAVQQKDLTSTMWTQVYYNPTYPTSGADTGFGTIHLWPIPTGTDYELVLYLPVGVSSFASLTQQYTLPPGYARMYEYQVALELAPEYGREIPGRVRQGADESLSLLKRQNVRRGDLGMDLGLVPAGRGVYNIYTDQ